MRPNLNPMARHSVALAAVLMHTLLGIVCAMPWLGAPSSGPGLAARLGRTIACPGCGRHFKTHRAVRQHQARMEKSSKCYKDLRPPIPSAWSGGGARAAGRAEDLSRGGRLPGMTDSDTDSAGARSPRRMDPVDQPARAASPADSDPADPGPAEHPGDPADPADVMQVQILSYTYIYNHIHGYTYIYKHIHTQYVHIHQYTCIYVHYLYARHGRRPKSTEFGRRSAPINEIPVFMGRYRVRKL